MDNRRSSVLSSRQGCVVYLLWLRTVYRTSPTKGYIPKAWRAAKVVFIPKMIRNRSIKSYRPLSLTSFNFKSLERIVDKYLLEGTLAVNTFHKNQHAYKWSKSTEAVSHALVHKVLQKALYYKELVLAVFLDIEGAFENARIATICQILQTKKATLKLVSWVRSALEERNWLL